MSYTTPSIARTGLPTRFVRAKAAKTKFGRQSAIKPKGFGFVYSKKRNCTF